LMVFSNLESAIGFCVNGADQVFECEIKKSRKKWGWVNRWCRRQAFKQIKNKKKYTDFIQDNMLPKSTVLADSVKLLKRVN
ncbi:MAG: hypothetical protein KDD03_13220, partial [Gelidibacter sp.]|nr:hypothetical protein [Gelidibacter sp.]